MTNIGDILVLSLIAGLTMTFPVEFWILQDRGPQTFGTRVAAGVVTAATAVLALAHLWWGQWVFAVIYAVAACIWWSAFWRR